MTIMERWSGRVALVTGASSGIGAETAKELVKHGLKVVGVARRLDRIQALQTELKSESGKLYALSCDITKESDILKTFEWIKENLGGVDILINNAGVIFKVPLTDGSTEDFRRIFEVNVIGLSICTREAIKSMKHREVDDGHIININSIWGHYVSGYVGPCPYSASKHAVTVLTEGLRRELVQQKSHIKVTSISPGVVNTEMFEQETKDFPNESLADYPLLQPKDIADAILYALGTPPHVQVHEITIRPIGEKI